MTYDEAFDARQAVGDRGALAVGTKLYFAEYGQFDGFPCLESLRISTFTGPDNGILRMDETIVIPARRLLGIFHCRVHYEEAGKNWPRVRQRHEWLGARPSAFADYYEVSSGEGRQWYGDQDLNRYLPHTSFHSDHTDVRVAAWTTTAKIRYVCKLEYVETVLRSQEVAALMHA